jgi:hypothetical protein
VIEFDPALRWQFLYLAGLKPNTVRHTIRFGVLIGEFYKGADALNAHDRTGWQTRRNAQTCDSGPRPKLQQCFPGTRKDCGCQHDGVEARPKTVQRLIRDNPRIEESVFR